MRAGGENIALYAFAGLLPLITFFGLLMGLKMKAHWSALGSVLVSLLVAALVFKMPMGLASLALSQGVAFGLFPIVFIIIMAVWIYDLTVRSGRFEDMRRIFARIGRGDMRVQAMVIGFAFGGMLEALAGFGAPVAIVAAMLVAIGMPKIKAALVTVVANSAPVAFGAMAIPVTTAASITQQNPHAIAAIAGLLVCLAAIIAPFLLLLIMDGFRGIRQVWPMALVLGVLFGGGQYLASNFFAYELTDVVASLLSLAGGLLFLRFWGPTTPEEQASQQVTDGVELTRSRISLALFPYILIVIVFAITKLWTIGINIPALLAKPTLKIEWPGLHGHLFTAAGEVSKSSIFNFNWLSTPGTTLFVCGLVTVIVYTVTGRDTHPLSFGEGLAELARGINRMKWSYLTIASVMALAYVMNFSGQTSAIGVALATTGSIFPFFSPVLGWLGTAVTGSATSSAALFAQMQSATATQIGANPALLTAANLAGSTLGKMISPQTAAVAAAAVRAEGQEGEVLGGAAKYTLFMLILMCTFVYLLSTPILSFLIS
nr:L-lactate permease [Corynebacterium caspium]